MDINSLPRHRLVESAAYALAVTLPPEAYRRLIQQGFREYVRVSKPIYAGWSFSQREFKVMFDILKQEYKKRGKAS